MLIESIINIETMDEKEKVKQIKLIIQTFKL